ncbi:hypothetical protein QIS74_08129 [Colletotrichum tabaci]|uniref:Uncharacterized protein n=1 Tax=Colletotrichum tabaci TaxID=1209068 RepID=A0AAV9T8T2_9PEZI
MWTQSARPWSSLTSVSRQLCAGHTDADEEDEAAHVSGTHGHRDTYRIQLLLEPLLAPFGMLGREFLVFFEGFDGFEKCGPAVNVFLESEVAILGDRLT